MKKLILLITVFTFIITADAQSTHGKKATVNDAHDRLANLDITLLPQGTVVKNGKITLNKGYRTVYLDSNRVMLIQKSNGETTGAFRCGCTGNAGDRSVAITKKEIHCVSGCSMEVAPGNYTKSSPSANKWKKL